MYVCIVRGTSYTCTLFLYLDLLSAILHVSNEKASEK